MILDRRVQFQKKAIVQDEFGSEVETWADEPYSPKWAFKRDLTAVERFRANQELAERTAWFIIRWFPDLNTADWRIVHEGIVYDITGIAERDVIMTNSFAVTRSTRRQFLELTCQATTGV